MIHSNHDPISYRVLDNPRHLFKNPNFSTPTCIWHSHLGDYHWHFVMSFGHEKTRMMSLDPNRWWKKWLYVQLHCHVVTVPESDTDRNLVMSCIKMLTYNKNTQLTDKKNSTDTVSGIIHSGDLKLSPIMKANLCASLKCGCSLSLTLAAHDSSFGRFAKTLWPTITGCINSQMPSKSATEMSEPLRYGWSARKMFSIWSRLLSSRLRNVSSLAVSTAFLRITGSRYCRSQPELV